MTQKNNMSQKEDLTAITRHKVVSEEEARYYISVIATAEEIANARGFTPENYPDMTAAIFSKIAQNLFWLRGGGRETETETEAKIEEEDEKINGVECGVTIAVEDITGRKITIESIAEDEDGLFLIQTNEGTIAKIGRAHV